MVKDKGAGHEKSHGGKMGHGVTEGISFESVMVKQNVIVAREEIGLVHDGILWALHHVSIFTGFR